VKLGVSPSNAHELTAREFLKWVRYKGERYGESPHGNISFRVWPGYAKKKKARGSERRTKYPAGVRLEAKKLRRVVSNTKCARGINGGPRTEKKKRMALIVLPPWTAPLGERQGVGTNQNHACRVSRSG